MCPRGQVLGLEIPRRQVPWPSTVVKYQFARWPIQSPCTGGGRGCIRHAGTLFLPGRRQRAWQRVRPQPGAGDETRVTATVRPRLCHVHGAVSSSSTIPVRTGRRRRVQVLYVSISSINQSISSWKQK